MVSLGAPFDVAVCRRGSKHRRGKSSTPALWRCSSRDGQALTIDMQVDTLLCGGRRITGVPDTGSRARQCAVSPRGRPRGGCVIFTGGASGDLASRGGPREAVHGRTRLVVICLLEERALARVVSSRGVLTWGNGNRPISPATAPGVVDWAQGRQAVVPLFPLGRQ